MVEFESIEKLVQLAIFGNFFKLHIVLLKTVQSEFGLIIDEDFQGLKS